MTQHPFVTPYLIGILATRLLTVYETYERTTDAIASRWGR